MRSMTGYGRGTCEVAGRRLHVELRSLNHRFLEVKLRLPWGDPAIEQQITQLLRTKIDRGVVTVSVRDEGGAAALALKVRVDLALARGYVEALEQLRQALGVVAPIPLELVATQPGVLAAGEALPDSELLWKALEPGLSQALDGLVESRAREGAAIAADLKERLASVERIASDLRTLTASAPEQYRARLTERLERARASGIDEQRIAQEVAIMADKLDVSEELTRLGAHLAELGRLLDQSGPQGRRLDFLTQELNREINTLGSKSPSAQCAARVVDAKAELEKLREQIQNVE
ncbi:MAG TPA: YicC/YloC family endoribonuclease [Polyangia bacterium]